MSDDFDDYLKDAHQDPEFSDSYKEAAKRAAEKAWDNAKETRSGERFWRVGPFDIYWTTIHTWGRHGTKALLVYTERNRYVLFTHQIRKSKGN